MKKFIALFAFAVLFAIPVIGADNDSVDVPVNLTIQETCSIHSCPIKK